MPFKDVQAAATLADRGRDVPPDPGAVSIEEWLDLFATELARLRPHLGYTTANSIGRVLCNQPARRAALAEARMAAEELGMMSKVDRPIG